MAYPQTLFQDYPQTLLQGHQQCLGDPVCLCFAVLFFLWNRFEIFPGISEMNLPTLSIPLAIVPPKPSFASISVKICGCSLCRAVDKANTAAAAMPIPAAIFFPF